MPGFTLMGKILILTGAIFILMGIMITLGNKIPWIGRFPGDIIIRREHFSFYFPLTSCIIISIILTLLFYFFKR